MQIQVVCWHCFFSTGEVLSGTMEVYHAKAKGWGEMVTGEWLLRWVKGLMDWLMNWFKTSQRLAEKINMWHWGTRWQGGPSPGSSFFNCFFWSGFLPLNWTWLWCSKWAPEEFYLQMEVTPQKLNMEPEKKSLEKEIPFENHHFFRFYVKFRGSITNLWLDFTMQHCDVSKPNHTDLFLCSRCFASWVMPIPIGSMVLV